MALSTKNHRTCLSPLLLLVFLALLVPPSPAAADTLAEKEEKPCCAALPLSSFPALILTLSSPLPEKKDVKVEGRLCQCFFSAADDNENDAIHDENDEEPLITLSVRGSTSARDYTKKSFTLNAQNASFSLLGMPRDDRWALLGVQDDRTLGSRSSLTFSAYRGAFNRWAPRTVLCEVYVRVVATAPTGDPASSSPPLDYRGVYLASERITRGKKRVDVSRFSADPAGNNASSLSGGYLLAYENDNVRPGEPVVGTRLSRLVVVVEYPSEEALSEATPSGGPLRYLSDFFNGLEKALLMPGPLVEVVVVEEEATTTTPKTKKTTIAALPPLAPFLDAAAFLDYFLLTELTKNPDGYRGSVKMHKDVDSPLVMGPPWDYGEAYGSCCGFPIEGYNKGGRSGPGTSGGSAISANGWRFNVCADPGRCLVEPADGTSQWFRRVWQDPSFRVGAAQRWRELRLEEGLSDASVAAALEAAERRLTDSGAAARNYARWSGEMPVKAEEMWVLERAGGIGGLGGRGVISPLRPEAAAAAATATAPLAPPPPPPQFVAANLFLKQWVMARLRWMDGALAAVADPSAPADAYLRVAA